MLIASNHRSKTEIALELLEIVNNGEHRMFRITNRLRASNTLTTALIKQLIYFQLLQERITIHGHTAIHTYHITRKGQHVLYHYYEAKKAVTTNGT